MTELVPIVIVCGLVAVLVICWLLIAHRPSDWLPPGTNPDAPAGMKKPKPPANPPKPLATHAQSGSQNVTERHLVYIPPYHMNRRMRRAMTKMARRAA